MGRSESDFGGMLPARHSLQANRSGSPACPVSGRGRQPHFEAAAGGLAGHAHHVTAVIARDLAAQREAKAKAGVARWPRSRCAIEGGEDVLALTLWHARAVIFDADDDSVAVAEELGTNGGAP